MNIAITQRIIINKNNDQADSLEQTYTQYFQDFGLSLIPIPNAIKNGPLYFKSLNIKGIILSGGGDIDPKLFGGKVDPQGNYMPLRDRLEIEILKFAINNKVPVLGICRGMQFLNVFFGGTIIQNLKNGYPNIKNHVAINHKIEVIDQKSVKYFSVKKGFVNSFHNCGISLQELSQEMKAFIKTEDNLIEGIYHPKFPIAGIMWHPERKSPDKQFNYKLIKAFIEKKLYWAV